MGSYIMQEKAIRAYPCSHCNATPGEYCTTRGGNRAYWAHSERWLLWRDELRREGHLR